MELECNLSHSIRLSRSIAARMISSPIPSLKPITNTILKWYSSKKKFHYTTIFCAHSSGDSLSRLFPTSRCETDFKNLNKTKWMNAVTLWIVVASCLTLESHPTKHNVSFVSLCLNYSNALQRVKGRRERIYYCLCLKWFCVWKLMFIVLHKLPIFHV